MPSHAMGEHLPHLVSILCPFPSALGIREFRHTHPRSPIDRLAIVAHWSTAFPDASARSHGGPMQGREG